MGSIAYLDCPTGIAGDMCLGALVSAGVPLEYLQDIVHKLGLAHEVKLWTESVHRGSIEATKMHVELLNYNGEEPPTIAIKQSHTDHVHSHIHAKHSHEEHTHEHSRKEHSHPIHRHLPDIEKIIRNAKLPKQIEARSLATFKELNLLLGFACGWRLC